MQKSKTITTTSQVSCITIVRILWHYCC